MSILTTDIIEQLGQAISDDNYVGVDLRQDDTLMTKYHDIKDLRSEARTVERRISQGFEEDSALPLWQKIAEQAEDILANYSKDLDIIAWYIEALIRLQQFAGLVRGFSLLNHLVEHHWQALYPQADAIELRVAAIAGLNGLESPGTLINSIFANNITAGSDGFGFWQYQQALQAAQIADTGQRQKREAVLGYSLETIKQARDQSPTTFYENLITELKTCIELYTRLNNLLNDLCGNMAPPSSYIKESLEQCLQEVQFLLNDSELTRLFAQQEPTVEASTPTDDLISDEIITPSVTHNANLREFNRQQALQELKKIANYFEQHEPHSPIPSLLRRAVNWGNLSFKELLQEMISNKESRETVFQLTGIHSE